MPISPGDIRTPDAFLHYVGALAETRGAHVYKTALEMLVDGMKDSWGGAQSLQVPSFAEVAAKLDQKHSDNWGR